jgi:trans-aconitate methyltransferase
MAKVDFDDFAEDYDELLKKQLSFFDSRVDYFAEHKISIVRNLIKHSPVRVLEFGCGVGNNIRHLVSYFPEAQISGCDISIKSLDMAAKRNPTAHLFPVPDETIPRDSKADLIFIANVFHHIPPDKRYATAQIVKGLLAREGELFIFEHNPLNPVTRHLVNTCPLDAEAKLLKPKELISLLNHVGFTITRKHYILFFPSFLSILRPLERYLAFLALGGQYVIQATL